MLFIPAAEKLSVSDICPVCARRPIILEIPSLAWAKGSETLPDLFVHWKAGFIPTIEGEEPYESGGSRMVL